MMFLTGLKDDYNTDGRVILESLDPKVLPGRLHANGETLLRLGQIYMQIDAPFGDLAQSTLQLSTYALKSDAAGDATYTQLGNEIASWTNEQQALAAQIQSMLEGAEFDGMAINEQQATHVIAEGQVLLDQASACASNPTHCPN
jgi:hypothetical protein